MLADFSRTGVEGGVRGAGGHQQSQNMTRENIGSWAMQTVRLLDKDDAYFKLTTKNKGG